MNYAKSKNSNGYAHLKYKIFHGLHFRYGVWRHIACNRLNFTEEAAWS